MKQNGLRALLDTRQSSDIARASLAEAAGAQTVATAETLVQSWDDTVRLFPCIGSKGRYPLRVSARPADSSCREKPKGGASSGSGCAA